MTGKLSIKVLGLIAMLVLTTSAFAQRVAVLNFNAGSGVTQMEVDGLSSIFNTYFAPKGAEIVERTSVDKILQEQKFQNSRFTNTDMVALGEMLNVSLVVVGDINVVMEQYNVDVRVVNVQTGTTVAKDGTSFSTGGSYRDMMKELGERLSNSLEKEIENLQITSDNNFNDNNGKASVLPKNMTTKITEDNSKRERTDVVVLEGFLKLYPEDLGEFSSNPTQLIKQINQQERYGYSSWRLPSQEELDLIRSNGYLSGNKYMTKEDPSGVLMLVTTKGKKVNYPIAKQEISIHAGIGWEDDYVLGLSAGIKYKYKPFENYNIRLLGEIGSEFVTKETYPNDDFLSVLPILVGVNYEHRFNQNWSIFTDIGLGPNIPLSGRRSDGYSEYDYQIGFTYSFEAGFAYDKFLFSIKGSFSSNDYTEHYHGYYNYYDYYSSIYLLLRLGYRF